MKKILKRLLVISILPLVLLYVSILLILTIFTWVLFEKDLVNNTCDFLFYKTSTFLDNN